MFYRLGAFTYRFRWPIVFFWLAVLGASLFFVPQVGGVLKPGGFAEETIEATRALSLLQDELGLSRSSLEILFRSEQLRADAPEFLADVDRVIAEVSQLEVVSQVLSYQTTGSRQFISEDGHTALVVLGLSITSDEAEQMLPELLAKLKPGELEMRVTGVPAIYADILAVSERDLQRAETYTLPLALVVLLLVFGGLVAAGTPLAMGAVSVATTLALVYFLAQGTDMSVFVMNMVTMLGLALGIDYSLLMVSRFRDEVQQREVGEAVAATVTTAGRAVFFSGLSTFIGLGALMLFDFMMLRSLGIGGALVVAFSVLVALSFLPALLGLLGGRINALAWWRPRQGRGGFWHGLASWVMRHPLLVFFPIVIFLLVLGLPFLGVQMGMVDATVLPKDVASRQGYDLLVEGFGPGAASPLLLAVEAEGRVLDEENVGALYDLTRRIARDERVERVESIVTLDPRIGKGQYQSLYANPSTIPFPEMRQAVESLSSEKVTLVRVYSKFGPMTDESKGLVQWVRGLEPGGDLRLRVGGLSAATEDIIGRLYSDFPRALGFIIVTTYLVLLVLFRSVVLPLKAVIVTALSILASYGALVFIFQEGNLAWLLGFSPLGFVDATLPILMFCILFGLSMDYEVFLLTRVKEEYDASGDNTRAVAWGLERTGRIITSAAMIMVVVTASFAMGDIIIIKSLGLGIAVAIFLDATIVRALLVPATMRLLGDWNWWAPGPLRRLLPSSDFRV